MSNQCRGITKSGERCSRKINNETKFCYQHSKAKFSFRFVDCCKATKSDKKCERKSDKKVFDISKRRFSKSKCVEGPVKGFSMKASCAPYKNC